jgi:spore maturation protein CgeB
VNVVLFYHSLISDWNHGNAHFLRGVAAALQAQGHGVRIYEPKDSWSLSNLIRDHGITPVLEFSRTFPTLRSERYDLRTLDLDRALESADLVIAHEWNDARLIALLGAHRKRSQRYLLFFHDTHHRAASAPDAIGGLDLSGYDGVLAFGESLRRLYLDRGWIQRAWTWHEAADIRIFHPVRVREKAGDVVWVGNWGDHERTAEVEEFFIEPVRALKLQSRIYGVRYPEEALDHIEKSGIHFGGWLPNYRVPSTFAHFTATVHIPRQPYARALPGIPTIRVFEACACGIPLVSAPWDDQERLFTFGKDFLIARTGEEMKKHLRSLLSDAALRQSLAHHALQTILARHTCDHRVQELLAIAEQLQPGISEKSSPAFMHTHSQGTPWTGI